ncbi:MAG: hypothetical protein ACJA2Q_002657 [Pseudohongiellaceae bacterium]
MLAEEGLNSIKLSFGLAGFSSDDEVFQSKQLRYLYFK